MALSFDRTWMWHPDFREDRTDTSGLFVNFRRQFVLAEATLSPVLIHITADTQYKLYINGVEAFFGPVKGDPTLWFYDELEIGPYLRKGRNLLAVRVLRLFHGTTYAPSFPRSTFGGLRIKYVGDDSALEGLFDSSEEWNTAIDNATILRVDEPEDAFLHIYEKSTSLLNPRLQWVSAKVLAFKNSTGNTLPWSLSPRLIPPMARQSATLTAIHNVESSLSPQIWEANIVGGAATLSKGESLVLPAGTSHRVDLQAEHHVTAFIRIHFRRPAQGGATIKITYSEGYEDEPVQTSWARRKGDRCDYSKGLFGPSDQYEFEGVGSKLDFMTTNAENAQHEIFAPFHWRTFRFIRLDIQVTSTDLVLERIEIESVNYPLDVQAELKVPQDANNTTTDMEHLWTTSIRTLRNCMHDCYEDCPFYEQLQYAMDTRSSALFTYLASGDDRLARQSIIQIHNSFQARFGLTASRAPSHRQQYIPNFSLYWICLVCDHFEYFGDRAFVKTFMPVIDAILAYFDSRILDNGLTASELRPGIWNYVDWTQQWKPHGIPPIVARTGVSTFTNQLYAYTLRMAGKLVAGLDRPAVADEYEQRATCIVSAVREHCFDGEFFTDSTAQVCTPADRSQHCQVWAVLSDTVRNIEAQELLRNSLRKAKEGLIVQESISMSFYTLRALSLAGGTVYEDVFREFWDPWRKQIQQNVTTWVEDDVSQRSDCHAWGSVPISESILEVVGIRPAEAGSKTIELRPRTSLFRAFTAQVPFMMEAGMRKGKIKVAWETEPSGDVIVQLEVLEFDERHSVTIFVVALDRKITLNTSHRTFNFVVKTRACI